MRKLNIKDAPLMVEWYHDPSVTRFFAIDFSNKSIIDAENFIRNSFTESNKHFAIADESDCYLGTISLKNIDMHLKSAEYAIVLRNSATGQGYAKKATNDIINYAFNTLSLNYIYLSVLPNNAHAINFYTHLGFEAYIKPENCDRNLNYFILKNESSI